MKDKKNKILKGLGITWLINALCFLIISYIPYGDTQLVHIEGLWTAMLIPLLFGAINSLIKPIAFKCAVPQKLGNIFLITCSVNLVLLILFSYLNILGMKFKIPSFFAIALVALLFSIISIVVSYVTGKNR